MMRNNVWFINLYANKEAAWVEMSYDGKVHWLAANRCARRCLQSSKFQNLAKKNGIVIDLEEMALV